ncbi:MAG: LysR family transcriptional regulator, partial [Pseudomonadota bacterium]
MNMHHLRTFVAVWRAGSIAKACDGLGLTQPAASGQIKALEATLGKTLFRRHTRGVEPTLVADELARAIGNRLDAAEAAFERLRARSSLLEGTVHFGGPAEFVGAKMPQVFTALLQTGIDIRVRLGGRDALYNWLATEEIDIAITASEPGDPALGFEPVFEERLLLVASPRLGLEGAPQPDWPWLAYDETMPLVRTYL